MTSIQETALPTDAPAQPEPTAASQFRALLRAFWAGEGRTGILLLAIAIVAVIVATAFGQVRLNAWNQPFYNAVARKDVAAFLDQVVVFGMIVSVLLVLNVAQGWLQQMMKLKLREWLTRDLIGQWLQQRRAFRISRVGEIGTNPDQRIHQDGQRLTELCADLGIGLFQSGLLLASFIGVLWVLSSGIVLTINGQDYTIPGYMVWCALLYAATGSWISWLVGRPLVVLNASRYAREAEFRSALVRTREHADGIAFYGDESREKQGLLAEFGTVLLAMRKIVTAAVRLTWVTAGYGWLAIVVPIVAASPGYFGGKLSFGELMVVAGAFYQVQQALRWFVDNAGTIADWRATLRRVMGFREALIDLDRLEPAGQRIELAPDPAGHLRFEGLNVMTPAGPTRLAEGDTEVRPGERVLVIGKPGCGKTTVFLAIAGLWSLGSGRILLPPTTSMAFLSERPYVPSGPLREALILSSSDGKTDAELAAALTRLGLGHLSRSLDLVGQWDRELSISELYRLACARLLLSKPQWVITDEALDVLDDSLDTDDSDGILSIFRNELSSTAVLSFARRPSPGDFYTRHLHLVGPAQRPATLRLERPEKTRPEFASSRARTGLQRQGRS